MYTIKPLEELDVIDDFLMNAIANDENVKVLPEVRHAYMTLEEKIFYERLEAKEEGKQEGKLEQAILSIVELLEDYDSIPEEIIETLKNESNLEQLKKWHKLAAKVNSIQAFIDKM